MKIAYITFLAFLCLTFYQTTSEHTRCMRQLHTDNLATLTALEEIANVLRRPKDAETLTSFTPRLPIATDPKVPVRKPEIVE